MRGVSLLLCAAALFQAPLQCGRRPDDPELRRYETPPEALHDLAERFAEEGDDSARRRTLQFLVERYPNSRFTPSAKEELADPPPSDGDH